MKILIIGGTVFLGRHMVDAALARGHEITLFNRGTTNADLYPEIEKLRGDRKSDVSALKGRQWDAVIDTCGYVPAHVRLTAQTLADWVGHYTFISSISAYAGFSTPNMDENAPTGTLADETVQEVAGENYGPLKALCERTLEAIMPGRALNVRAGLIVGPHDATDRFTYWPVRVQRGGEILAPISPDYLVQYIDARDLSEWCVRMAEVGKGGVYNVTGRPQPVGGLLDAAKQVSGSDATFHWVDETFLLENEVGPWVELPLWLPSDMHGMAQLNVNKALSDGLTFRSAQDTVRAVLDWHANRTASQHEQSPKAGLAPEKESRLIALWKARQTA